MKAFVDPGRNPDLTVVEMDEGDRLAFILSQVALPYLHRRRGERPPTRMPMIDDADLPAWLRHAEAQDPHTPPIDDGRSAERWDYVLGEMIWALEAVAQGNAFMTRHVVEPGISELHPSKERPGTFDVVIRKSGVVDGEGVRTDGERRREGMRLFTRYCAGV